MKACLLLVILVATLCALPKAGSAQSQEKTGRPESQKNDPKAESKEKQDFLPPQAVIVDGKPGLKFTTRKFGSAVVALESRDGEDVISFSVNHQRAFSFEPGRLYVGKNRIIFDPMMDKGDYFNVSRVEVQKSGMDKRMVWGDNGYHILVDLKDGGNKRLFLRLNENDDLVWSGQVKPIIQFYEKAWGDFDAAKAEILGLTATLRKTDETEESEEEAEDYLVIDSRYDRFKDVTRSQTIRMLIRSKQRAIRMQADFTSPGKGGKVPEKVRLTFVVRTAKPIFRSEDDREITFLIDGDRLALGPAPILSEDEGKATIQQIIGHQIAWATFEKMIKAKKLELQIGESEYQITDKHIEAFRALAEAAESKSND